MRTILLRIFYVALVLCASLVLTFIWNGGPPAEIYAQVAGSSFVLGLGCFLIWFTLTLLDIHREIAKD